jgi:hypothetical protein
LWKKLSWWLIVLLTPSILILDLIIHLMGGVSISQYIWNWKGTEIGSVIFIALGALFMHFVGGTSGNGYRS